MTEFHKAMVPRSSTVHVLNDVYVNVVPLRYAEYNSQSRPFAKMSAFTLSDDPRRMCNLMCDAVRAASCDTAVVWMSVKSSSAFFIDRIQSVTNSGLEFDKAVQEGKVKIAVQHSIFPLTCRHMQQ